MQNHQLVCVSMKVPAMADEESQANSQAKYKTHGDKKTKLVSSVWTWLRSLRRDNERCDIEPETFGDWIMRQKQAMKGWDRRD